LSNWASVNDWACASVSAGRTFEPVLTSPDQYAKWLDRVSKPMTVLASSDGNTDYSAFWVGLDGDGTKDLVQAGT
jgi:hypothetical protein